MDIVIVGAGRTGRSVIEHATRDGHDVVVVERDGEVASETSSNHDCLVINADATSRDILIEADVETADALISTTANDSTNLMVMMLGRDLGAGTLLCSVNDPANIGVFRELGVNTVESPHQLNGRYLYRRVQRPAIRDFIDLGDGAEIIEVTIAGDAPLAGTTLLDAGDEGYIPDETVVVAVRREKGLVVPNGETELRAGDLVTVFSRDGPTSELMAAFEGRQ